MLLSRLRQARLASFVDRTSEVAAFCSFLEDSEKNVFWISGESGIGKSTLLAKLITECVPEEFSIVELSGSAIRQDEPLDLMRSISGQLGLLAFSRFQQALSRQDRVLIDVAPSNAVAVASNATLTNSSVGIIAGVQIEAVNVSIASTSESTFAQNQLNRLTDCFLEDLTEFGQNHSALFCIDAAERLTTRCKEWISNELIPAMIDRVRGAKFLVFSQETAAFEDHLRSFIILHQLGPVTPEVIRDYLKLQKIREDILEGAAQALFVSTNGNMLMIATHTQRLVALC